MYFFFPVPPPPPLMRAAVLEPVRGIVHDPDHRPVRGATVVAKSSTSDYSQTVATGADGAFEIASIPPGAYRVTVTHEGFAPAIQEIVVGSSTGPVLHFQLALGAVQSSVTVAESALAVNAEQMTPATMISRSEIANTPGASLSNNLSAITDYVPGAWI